MRASQGVPGLKAVRVRGCVVLLLTELTGTPSYMSVVAARPPNSIPSMTDVLARDYGYLERACAARVDYLSLFEGREGIPRITLIFSVQEHGI
jgi:hypothetical protein